MASYYWIAASGSWHTATNWSTSTGSTTGGEASPSGDGSVPTSSDDVFFDANSGDCAVSAFTEINSLTTSGYTDTITITNIMRVVQTSTSTWAHSGGTIHCNRTNSFALYLRSIEASGVTLVVGPSASITNENNSIVLLEKNVNVSGSIDAPVKYNNNAASVTLKIVGDTSFNKTVSMWSTVTNTWTLDNSGNYDLTFNESLELAYVSWSAGTGTITLSGDQPQDINFNSETVEAIEIDTTSTVSLTGDVDTDSLTLTAGTLDVNAQTLETTGNLTMAAGTSLIE